MHTHVRTAKSQIPHNHVNRRLLQMQDAKSIEQNEKLFAIYGLSFT